MKRVAFLAVALALVAVAAAADHTKDSLDTVRKNLAEKKAVMIDVREKAEWNEGHLAGALLKPLSRLRDRSVDPKVEMKDIDKKTIVYCHCRAGARALVAASILDKLGYDVRPLKQGYGELLKAGFPKAE